MWLIRHRLATPKPADSLDIDYYSHKRGLQAGTMVFGINMGVWAFDRYIRKADFAYINGRTIKDNLKHGFVWDNDAMGTNMFMHPYHGSLYFNSARSNGYNFWQSGLFAFGGSFIWEMFMENEYPSTYDIIATPIGGMALGEVTYEVEPKTLNAQGDRSRAILHAVGLRLDLKLRKQLYLTSTFMNYTRDTKYRYHANVFSNTSEGRIMLTYKY